MKKTEFFTVRDKTTRITTYDDMAEIVAYLESKGDFHDGTIEVIGHDEESTTIGFKHYNDPEYTIHRLIFTGNVELRLDVDLLVRCIYEIQCRAEERVNVFFDGTGIEVTADHVVLQIQELMA